MKLSLIVPCYNEAENIDAFQKAAMSSFSDCGYDFEIVFIDDGKLVAIGKHDDLYANCPEYKNMVDLQQLEEEGGNS